MTYNGKIYKFKDVTVLPKPVQKNCPIWIASNPRSTGELEGRSGQHRGELRAGRQVRRRLDDDHGHPARSTRRTSSKVLSYAKKYGKGKSKFKASLYYNVNMGEKQKAGAEAVDFLTKYYREDASGVLDKWVAFGTKGDVMKKLEAFVDAGVEDFNIRFVAWDQIHQLKKFSKEILPSFA